MQGPREEIIIDMEDMCHTALSNWRDYQRAMEKKQGNSPKRIIFFRGLLLSVLARCFTYNNHIDGVSEGEFQRVVTDGAFIAFV